ncbi:19430_t:CDS:1, partial [Dentiscutata erythropus]
IKKNISNEKIYKFIDECVEEYTENFTQFHKLNKLPFVKTSIFNFIKEDMNDVALDGSHRFYKFKHKKLYDFFYDHYKSSYKNEFYELYNFGAMWKGEELFRWI